MFGPKMWRIGFLAGLGLALVIGPAVGPLIATAQPSSIEVAIDAPTAGVTLQNGVPIEIRGWAVDTSSEQGTGIAAIEISLDSQNGMASEPMFATYGISRPDVATVYGRPDWTPTGFTYTWTPQDLPEGPQTIRVWAHTNQQISRASTVTIALGPSLASIRATQTAAPPLPTPTDTPLPGGLRVENNIFNCSIDLTLLAPASFSSRPCPQSPTPTQRPPAAP